MTDLRSKVVRANPCLTGVQIVLSNRHVHLCEIVRSGHGMVDKFKVSRFVGAAETVVDGGRSIVCCLPVRDDSVGPVKNVSE
jgi:hypothetical protein